MPEKIIDRGIFYQQKNYPPGSNEWPECPFFQDIKGCCDFAGIDVGDFYCGVTAHIFEMGKDGGSIIKSYGSKLFCSDVYKTLSSQIALLEKPNDNDPVEQALKEEILERFKMATFNTRYHSRGSDGDEDYSGPVQPSDVESDVAIMEAKSYLGHLQRVLSINEKSKPEDCQIQP